MMGHSLSLAQYGDLFLHYLLLSLLSIGGAITTAPEMHRDLVGQQGWLSDTQFTSSIALAQAAPGPNILFSLLGSLLVVGFALAQGLSLAPRGDGLMLLAILVCGLGYAEGARLSRSLGGWQVICWALVLALPLMLGLSWWRLPASWSGIGLPAWLGLAYVSLFSMLIGFVFWYRGLAQGGIASVGQLQLLQPLFGLALAAGLLGEAVSPAMLGVTLAVILCVAGARRFGR